MNETTQTVSETSSATETTNINKETKQAKDANTETTSVTDTAATETTTSTQQPAPEVFSMSIPFFSLSIVECVLAFCLIGVVLQQSKNASGITASSYSGGNSDSYWNKNKSRSKESKLIRLTIILTVAFFIVTLALGFVK